MSSTILTSTLVPIDYTDYSRIVPISIGFSILAILIAGFILSLIALKRPLHTVTHLLICNTCVWTIVCCVAQSNHYIYLFFITWETSDISCRLRGFFAYLTIAGVIYSYLIQSISRLFFIVFANKYRWCISLKSHLVLLCIQWIVVIMITSPAILTQDIFFRPNTLCWVTALYPLHQQYTLFAYYALPTLMILLIYIYVYYRVKYSSARTNNGTQRNQQQNRDFQLFRNILILFGIYLSGGLPTTIYLLTRIGIFYPMGLVFVSITVCIEKAITLYLDREIRNTMKTLIRRARPPRVLPSLT